MSLLRWKTALVLIALWQSSALAQSPDTISAALQAFVQSRDLSGAVALVANKDGILYHQALGMQNLETQTPMTKDTLFRIASMTKPITATAVMMLVDEGKLSVDDPVAKHLPAFQGQMLVASREKGKVCLVKPARAITLRDLLTHTSGLPGGYPHGLADVYQKRQWTLKETTLAMSQQPLQFEPGTKWSYCNAGIDTLGRIVEVASGMRYEDFLQKRIFDPLGMHDTTFYPTAAQLKRVAVVYNKTNGRLIAPPSPLLVEAPPGSKHPVPAGGLYSTAADLAKFYRMMLNHGEWDGKQIVSEQSVAAMTKTQTGDIPTGFVSGMSFGFGWAVVKEPKGVTGMLSAGTFGHGGAFGTQGWIDPKAGRIYILLIQRVGLPNGDDSPMRKAFQEAAAR